MIDVAVLLLEDARDSDEGGLTDARLLTAGSRRSAAAGRRVTWCAGGRSNWRRRTTRRVVGASGRRRSAAGRRLHARHDEREVVVRDRTFHSCGGNDPRRAFMSAGSVRVLT